jgi:hypothetical protein
MADARSPEEFVQRADDLIDVAWIGWCVLGFEQIEDGRAVQAGGQVARTRQDVEVGVLESFALGVAGYVGPGAAGCLMQCLG